MAPLGRHFTDLLSKAESAPDSEPTLRGVIGPDEADSRAICKSDGSAIGRYEFADTELDNGTPASQ